MTGWRGLAEQSSDRFGHVGRISVGDNLVKERNAAQAIFTNVGAGFDGSFFEAAKDGVSEAELSLPTPIIQLLKHEIIVRVEEGVRVDIGVSVLFLEGRQGVGPEDEETASKRASDGFDGSAGIRFATAKGRNVGECDVAVCGEPEILAEADAGLFVLGPRGKVGVGRGNDGKLGDSRDGRIKGTDTSFGLVPGFTATFFW